MSSWIDRRVAGETAIGVSAVLVAGLLAVLVGWVNGHLRHSSETAAVTVGALFVLLISLPPVVYRLRKRRRSDDASLLALWTLAPASLVLLASYFYVVSFSTLYPGDFLIWSESDFVNDILKLRVGHPLYGPLADNDSFFYTPGSPILTGFLAASIGRGSSIAVFRMIQLFYVLGAALLGFASLRWILRLARVREDELAHFPWALLWVPMLFLFAGNPLTNAFVRNLNSDSLAQLVSAAGFYLLVRHAATGDARLVPWMAALPAVGFLAKQNVAVWASLFFVYLLFFDQARSPRQLARYTAIAVGALGGVIGGCLLLWGEPFYNWVFHVLAQHRVSPLRSLNNLLLAWPYPAVGLFAGLVLLRGDRCRPLLGPWIVWCCFMTITALTSGIAGMLNHMGPPSLLAGIWFAAAITLLWIRELPGSGREVSGQRSFAYVLAVPLLLLSFKGLGLVHVPIRPTSADDSLRYFEEIQSEFSALPSRDVLLDAGTWAYLEDGVVMKDRAPAIGELGYSATGDFSGVIDRLNRKRYRKVMVRHLHDRNFWYEHWRWPEPSGIREALLRNYEEVRVIDAVRGDRRYLFGAISVLVPRP